MKTIEEVLTERAKMKPIAAKGMLQEKTNKIFELQKQSIFGSRYLLIPHCKDYVGRLPRLHGCFVFVVKSELPHTILCGVSPFDASSKFQSDFHVGGHTSLSEGDDVLFAGELFFQNASLIKWSNASGHYLPDCCLRYLNLTPYLKKLLPDEKFEEFKHPFL